MMQKFVLTIVTILLFAPVTGQNFDYKNLARQSKDSTSKLFYEKLNKDFTLDGENFTTEKVIALLIGYTASDKYNGYGHVDLERAYQYADQVPNDTILKYAPEYLAINQISLAVNYRLWQTYDKSKNKLMAKRYKKRFELLCEAILKTGNGTFDHPYFVISPLDGQVIISLYLKKPIIMMGSGVDKNGNFCEILTITEGNDTNDLYFVVDHAMAEFRAQLNQVKNNSEIKYDLDENGKLIPRK